MMTEKQRILYYYIQESDKAINQISEKLDVNVDSSKIWQILTEYFDFFDNPVEIIYKELDSESIYNIIVDNYLHYLSPATIIKIEKSIIPEEFFNDSIIKGIIKSKGEIWEIHKNDADYFPSDPHAHNCDTGLKLHLGNGELFRKRKYITKIKKKDLLLIRKLIEAKISHIELPILNS